MEMDFGSLTFIVLSLLLLFDGIIFGVATAKGVTSIILIILGLIVASFIGVSVPFLNSSTGNFLGDIENLFMMAVNRYGPAFFAMPILWIVGFLIGIFAI
jgi:hypothetical protein